MINLNKKYMVNSKRQDEDIQKNREENNHLCRRNSVEYKQNKTNKQNCAGEDIGLNRRQNITVPNI